MNKSNKFWADNKILLLAGAVFILTAAVFWIIRPEPNPDNPPGAATASLPERIICAAPSVTEMVFALGRGDRVVGVSEFSFFPHEAADKPRIGGLFNPSKEKIFALQPDLVVTQGQHAALSRFCREQDIPLINLHIETLDHIRSALEKLGRLLKAREKARRLIADLNSRLASVRDKTGSLPPRKVFLSLGHTPGDLTGIMTASSGTFLQELIELAGGINIFHDLSARYPRVSKEALVTRTPEVIIEILAEGLSYKNKALLRRDWERLSALPAGQEDRIHFLTQDYLLIPGLRAAQTAEAFARIIHPEAFDD
jgi:iron complex transport system substrate-binding protein